MSYSNIESQIAQEKSVDAAEREIPVIEKLIDSDGWAYLQRRLRQEQARIKDRLVASITEAETNALRAVYHEIDNILGIPLRDLRTHMTTLERAQRK